MLVDKVPHEVSSSKNPYVAHLRFFGCEAFLHAPKEKRSKLDNKAEKCIFIGYKVRLKGNKLWNPVTKKMVYSHDLVFKEVENTSRFEDESK